jgi:hypothetical protein
MAAALGDDFWDLAQQLLDERVPGAGALMLRQDVELPNDRALATEVEIAHTDHRTVSFGNEGASRLQTAQNRLVGPPRGQPMGDVLRAGEIVRPKPHPNSRSHELKTIRSAPELPYACHVGWRELSERYARLNVR